MLLSKRHIIKSITWRFLATSDTILIAYFISGDFNIGMKIGLIEVFSKMILYYIHELFWFNSKYIAAFKRHIYKTFSWRTIGTIDTIIVSLIVTGNVSMGFNIGIIEIFTKMLLYYFHEKIWYLSNFGLRSKN